MPRVMLASSIESHSCDHTSILHHTIIECTIKLFQPGFSHSFFYAHFITSFLFISMQYCKSLRRFYSFKRFMRNGFMRNRLEPKIGCFRKGTCNKSLLQKISMNAVIAARTMSIVHIRQCLNSVSANQYTCHSFGCHLSCAPTLV